MLPGAIGRLLWRTAPLAPEQATGHADDEQNGTDQNLPDAPADHTTLPPDPRPFLDDLSLILFHGQPRSAIGAPTARSISTAAS